MGPEIRNALHGPGFLLLTVLLYRLTAQAAPVTRRLLFTGAMAIVTAVLSEFAQLAVDRSTSLLDLASDALGIATGLTICYVVSRPRSSHPRQHVQTGLTILLCLLTFLPLTLSIRIAVLQAWAFPVLTAFGSGWTADVSHPIGRASLTTTAPAADWPQKDGRVLRAQPSTDRYSGVYIRPFSNWTGFEALVFTLAADRDGCKATLRIQDLDHDFTFRDRYNKALRVQRQPTAFRIALSEVREAPENRPLDLARIRDVALFVSGQNRCSELVLGNLRLAR